MIWFLFFLAVVVASAIFIWDYRRKARAREAAAQKRFEEMFAAKSAAAPPAPAAAGAPLPAAPAGPSTAAPAAAPAAVSAAPVADRFLGKVQTLVYRLLKAGIPDHEVFANVTLAAVIGSRNEQESRRLAQHRVDFVVCDKEMKVVAAVEVETGAPTAGEQRFRADALKAAGIGLVRIDAAALPRREEIRGLVLGKAGA